MYEKFKALTDSKHVSAYRVSKDLGIPQSTFSDWKAGRSTPKQDKIKKIADYFDVPVSYFYDEAIYDVAAGDGRYNDVPEYIDDAYPHDSDYSYVRIHGDSMLPELRDGDVVTVHHQTETSPKDYTVVKIDGEKETIKMVEIVQDGVWLRALNKDVYPDKFYSIQEVMTLPITIIGKAVSVRRDL